MTSVTGSGSIPAATVSSTNPGVTYRTVAPGVYTPISGTPVTTVSALPTTTGAAITSAATVAQPITTGTRIIGSSATLVQAATVPAVTASVPVADAKEAAVAKDDDKKKKPKPAKLAKVVQRK